MKKLKLDLQGLGTQLTKVEMKKVVGGYDSGGSNCLFCRTSGGDECWVRSTSGDAWGECGKIYPSLQIASAHYGTCVSSCRS